MLRTRRNTHKLLLALLVAAALVFFLRGVRRSENSEAPASEGFEGLIRQMERQVNPRLGHLGEPAFLEGKDKERGDESVRMFAMNTVLSDRVPLNRTLRDFRNPGCKHFKYNPKLKASVVIIFFNELLSAVLRTVWSVILQSPKHLLHEIILVDDASTDENLGSLLDYYVTTRLSNRRVQVIHLKSRQGLIRARLNGARAASGEVLIFLDAHCEATVDWLEPLLARIEEDRTAVLIPVIDVIEAETLQYSTNGDVTYQVGGFSWSGHYTWIDVQNESDKRKLTPVKSPTMAGGLFAIEREYFWETGSYDEQMEGWGGENLEMSFRIWMCGGRLETVPCSRVGHIFRSFHPYKIPDDKDTHGINTARLAHVWMDEYKRLYFMHAPALENNPAIGDLTHRRQLRQKLKCKSFKWYLDNVYPEKFIPDEKVQAYGQVRNQNGMCLDNLQLPDDHVGALGLYMCHPYLAMSQYFSLTLSGELRQENHCAEAHFNGKVQLAECHHRKREQNWRYHVGNGSLESVQLGLCLSGKGVENGGGLSVAKCKKGGFQSWSFTYLNGSVFGV